ncbi:MAG: hypothetical protein Kow0074_14960 [Candidatus Zixiibacteriota bacterium]
MLCTSLLLLALVSAASAQPPTAPHDEYGILDTVSITVTHRGGDQWIAEVELTNDENIAAVTLPLSWRPGTEKFRIDSANYKDLRTSYFALKTFFPDTTKGTILIGLISDLGTGIPPLDPGSGPIARLYFTSIDDSANTLSIDTTFIRPHNVLQLVTPDVRAILPAFETRKALRHNENETSK